MVGAESCRCIGSIGLPGVRIQQHRSRPLRRDRNRETLSFADTFYSFTGLTNGIAYRFRIESINANGVGSASDLSASVVPAVPWK